MKPKRIPLTDGTVIIDGLSKLIVIDKCFVLKHFPFNYDFDKGELLRKGVPCSAQTFVTKKGREAVRIGVGDSHIFRYYWGSGDRSWNGWKRRSIANALFSEAKATSNGGGCWMEVEVLESKTTPISAEEQSYIEEL